MIYDTTIKLIKKNPIIGFGSNGFNLYYMQEQAKQLKKDPNNAYLADEIHGPLSEPLSIIVSYGILGFSMLFVLVFSILYPVIRSIDKQIQSYVSLLMVIIIFSLFSYPFHYFSICIISVITASILRYNVRIIEISSKGKYIGFFSLLCLLVISSYITLSISFINHYKWDKAADAAALGKQNKALIEYEHIMPKLKNDGNFLYNYASVLNQCNRYEKSSRIVTLCRERTSSYDIELLDADNAYFMNDYNKCLICLDKAHEMIPARFYPLYKKVQTLLRANNKKDAKELAQNILLKPEKVKSEETRRIKEEMNILIKHISK